MRPNESHTSASAAVIHLTMPSTVTNNSAAAAAPAAGTSNNDKGNNSTTTTSTTAETFRRLHPRTYLSRFLAEHIRPDGREPSDSRDLSINVGSISTADGSALVRLGATTVVCGVKAEIAEPDIDVPNAGFLGALRASY